MGEKKGKLKKAFQDFTYEKFLARMKFEQSKDDVERKNLIPPIAEATIDIAKQVYRADLAAAEKKYQTLRASVLNPHHPDLPPIASPGTGPS